MAKCCVLVNCAHTTSCISRASRTPTSFCTTTSSLKGGIPLRGRVPHPLPPYRCRIEGEDAIEGDRQPSFWIGFGIRHAPGDVSIWSHQHGSPRSDSIQFFPLGRPVD